MHLLNPIPGSNVIKAICHCDENAGWTVLQRRLDGSVDFYLYWQDFVNGFGSVNGEYWIGLEAIYRLTRENRKLNIFLEADDGEIRVANYTTFYIDGADTFYRLHVSH